MFYRGRVMRRQPVACYATPQSIQDQKRKFEELARIFRARFYWNVTSVTGTLSDEALTKLGLLGPFPYPDLITGVLALQCPPAKPIWLRMVDLGTYTACSQLALKPEQGDVHRCFVVVDKSGATPKLTVAVHLAPLGDLGEVIDYYCNETVIVGEDRKLTVATTTGRSSTAVASVNERRQFDLPRGPVEIYMVLFSTQKDVIAMQANNMLSYCAPGSVDQLSVGFV